MSAHYEIRHAGRSRTDGFSQVLQETQDHFAMDGIDILGEGYKEIVHTNEFHESYVDRMVSGLDADTAHNMRVLIENNRANLLQEAGLGGISPVSSLNVPLLRKSFPRLAVAKSFPTEAVEHPKFKVVYIEPYIKDANGIKHKLPESIMPNDPANEDHISRKLLNVVDIPVANLSATTSPAITGPYGDSLVGHNMVDGIAEWTVSATRNAEVDSDVRLESVRLSAAFIAAWNEDISPAPTSGPDAAQDEKDALTTTTDLEVLTLDEIPSTVANRQPPRKDTCVMDTRTNTLHTPVIVRHPGFEDEYMEVGKFFLSVDREFGVLSGVYQNYDATTPEYVETFTMSAYVATEFNNYTQEVGFDLQDVEIHVPQAPHISAPLTTERLGDVYKMYNVDGAAKIIEIMSDTLAQTVDKDGIAFLQRTWERSPRRYAGAFDASPLATYHGSPTEWLREIRRVIDYHASVMLDDSRFRQGYFVILGNPVDVNIIPGTEWYINNGEEDPSSGIVSAYSFGAMNSAHRYQVLATQNVGRGVLWLFYVPTTEDQKTVMYYPYNFSIERNNGYRDPNYSNVPAIVMHRRHAFKDFIPLITRITVTNNDGKLLAVHSSDSVRPQQ